MNNYNSTSKCTSSVLNEHTTGHSTHGFQPRSAGLMKRIPALDTVAGVAVFR